MLHLRRTAHMARTARAALLIRRQLTVCSTVSELRQWRQQQQPHSVGFVPTMGALHQGHVALAKASRAQCDRTIASIFVNPAQFAAHEDLEHYPRTLESDLDMLRDHQVDCVFLPTREMMYGDGSTDPLAAGEVGTFVQVRGMDRAMEGAVRPHFFTGVATVVCKLFNMVQPTDAFFGQKDGQQCAIVTRMVHDLHLPLRIHRVPTVRDTDGLALSSRNRYLTPAERTQAPRLYRALLTGASVARVGTAAEVCTAVRNALTDKPALAIDYISLADFSSLRPVEGALELERRQVILLAAITTPETGTRLLDNVLINDTLLV